MGYGAHFSTITISISDIYAITQAFPPAIFMIDPLMYISLFPLRIVVAILAISAGISGSNLWIPVYVITLNLIVLQIIPKESASVQARSACPDDKR